MGNNTEPAGRPPRQPEPATVRQVTWQQLRRVNAHRTCRVTDETIRRVIGEITAARGAKPIADTVILAALRVAMRVPETLADAVREVETATYAGPVPHEPGG